MKFNDSFKITRVLILLAFVGLGFFLGKLWFEIRIPKEFKGEEGSTRLDLFWEVWNLLEEKYPFQEPSNDDKVYSAIEGLAQSYGDDYTMFLPPVDATYLNDTVVGEFGGIGAEINVVNGILVVVAPLEGSPSMKAGLLPGDMIIEIDGASITGMTLNEAIGLIRGEPGSIVTLGIVRNTEDEILEVPVTRELVSIPVIDTEVVDNVFVIHLYNFNEASGSLFTEALTQYTQGNYEGLVIDLRNNPGGYLDAAVDIASLFVPQGSLIVSEDFGSSEIDPVRYYSKGDPLVKQQGIPIVVLINYGSASASEILAAALQEYQVAIIAGEQSYGKGSVQELIQLPDDTALKVTVAKWLTPKGNLIDHKGVTPDLYLESILDSSYDEQLLDLVDMMKQGITISSPLEAQAS